LQKNEKNTRPENYPLKGRNKRKARAKKGLTRNQKKDSDRGEKVSPKNGKRHQNRKKNSSKSDTMGTPKKNPQNQPNKKKRKANEKGNNPERTIRNRSIQAQKKK